MHDWAKVTAVNVVIFLASFYISSTQDMFASDDEGELAGDAGDGARSPDPAQRQNVASFDEDSGKKKTGLWIRIIFLRIRIQLWIFWVPDPGKSSLYYCN